MRAYAFLDTLIEPAEREPRRAPQGFTCTPTTSKQYLFGVLADTGLLGGVGHCFGGVLWNKGGRKEFGATLCWR